MNNRKIGFSTLTLALCFGLTIALLASCSEDEDSTLTLPELFAEGSATIDVAVNDTITLEFSSVFRGFDTTYYVTSNQSLYEAKLVSISLGDLAFDSATVSTNLLKIWSKELLPPSATIDLTIDIQWWDENNALVETITKQYEITTAGESFPMEVIAGTYPVDRQYYFLKDEYDKAFVALERLPSDVSSLSVSWYDSSDKLMHSSGVTKNTDKNRLDFDLPQLENESIYAYELYQDNSLLKRVDFRTSKYNTFDQKIENLVVDAKATKVYYHSQYFKYPLIQTASISSEGFDAAEADFDLTGFYYDEEADYIHPYCAGLVKLKFNPEDNNWFNLYIKSLIYEPFPDFDYEFIAPKELGDSLFLAMRFEFENDLESLSDAEIASGTATPTIQTALKIGNYMAHSTKLEFNNLQYIVVNRYISDESLPRSPRVKIIMDQLFKLPDPDTYKYQMEYTLPDGTVTSSLDYEMVYEF